MILVRKYWQSWNSEDYPIFLKYVYSSFEIDFSVWQITNQTTKKIHCSNNPRILKSILHSSATFTSRFNHSHELTLDECAEFFLFRLFYAKNPTCHLLLRVYQTLVEISRYIMGNFNATVDITMIIRSLHESSINHFWFSM